MRKLGILITVLVVINILVMDVVLVNLWNRPNQIETKTIVETKIISQETNTSPTPSIKVSPTKKMEVDSPILSKTKSVAVVPIPGSGETKENNWTNVYGSEFYFDSEDYPGMSEAYWEANLKLFNGNGKAFARLFDITAGIEVWGSEIYSESQNYEAVKSGKISLRPGNRLYRVQLKSLTADTTVYNFGTIKIVSLN